jgi:hypothetical protein
MKPLILTFLTLFFLFPDLTVGQKSYVQEKLTKSADAGKETIKYANEVVLEYFKKAKEITFVQNLSYESKTRGEIEGITMKIGGAASKITKAKKKAKEINCIEVVLESDSALTNYRAANKLFENAIENLNIVMKADNQNEYSSNFIKAKENVNEGILYLYAGLKDLNDALEKLKSCNSE